MFSRSTKQSEPDSQPAKVQKQLKQKEVAANDYEEEEEEEEEGVRGRGKKAASRGRKRKASNEGRLTETDQHVFPLYALTSLHWLVICSADLQLSAEDAVRSYWNDIVSEHAHAWI